MDLLSFLSGLVLAGGGAAVAWAVWLQPLTLERAKDEADEAARREAEAQATARVVKEREADQVALTTSRRELKELEARARGREDAFDRRQDALEDRERALRQREAELTGARATLEAERAEVERGVQRGLRELERVSGLPREEAERLLLERVEARCRAEAEAARARHEAALEAEVDARARTVLLAAVERAAVAHARSSLVSVVALPAGLEDAEAKGLLIGRDGRNARAFEAAAGVDLLIDDTPGVVVVSSFDPARREVARRALVRLLEEGRVTPPRIDEVIALARGELEAGLVDLGRAAAVEAGVEGLPTALATLVGRLELHTSEGGNVRRHAIETARVAGLLAAELGLDPALARRAGLLHDIGLSVEGGMTGASGAATDGAHALAGASEAARQGEDPRVVEAIAGHETATAEASSHLVAVVRIANALTAARPGARDGALEQAIRRRGEVEAIAGKVQGVERAWAVQAGRELRVIVDPTKVSEKAASRLARDVAREVESLAPGPGAVRVVVIRETRHAS